MNATVNNAAIQSDTILNAAADSKGWPAAATLPEVIQIARRKFGKRLTGVFIMTYGGGAQVEVRVKRNTYDGFTRVALIQAYRLN